MAGLLEELKRRDVYKVATIYLAVSWLFLQIGDTLFPVFELPDNSLRVLAILLFIGFPVSISLAWIYEITPAGIRKTVASPEKLAIRLKNRDYLLVATLSFLTMVVVVQQVTIISSNSISRPAVSTAVDTASEDESDLRELLDTLPAIEQQSDRPSIAVLPFANLSPDPDNAYFAAGIHEEILNQLAKISGLRVISRTAVLKYQDTTVSPGEIAEELQVGTIMEGSVRYAGNSVRITTQLIQAEDNSHLWSEAYDRELSDIFAIQSEVAVAVASALQANLQPDVRLQLEMPATSNLDAYSLFLRTRFRQEQAANRQDLSEDGWIVQGIRDMRRAIDLDPGFARAYAELAFLIDRQGAEIGFDGDRAAFLAEQERLAKKALELDPSLGRAYQLLASVSESQRKWQEAEEFYELAVRGSDAEARVLLSYARFSSLLNRPDQAYLLIDRAIAIEPTSSAAWGRAALFRVRHRDYETALNFLERLRASGDEVNFYWLRAVTLYFLGRHRQALTDIEIADDLLRDFPGVTGGVYAYVRCQLGLDDHLVELASDYGRASPLFLDTAIAISVCQQEIDQAFAHINDLMETGENIWLLEQPFDVLREDPRWQYVHGYMNLANH